MGDSPKVSVVVPIYNSSKYLHECLDSLYNQTMKDIEFICINDGSKDDSLKIINEYVSKDDRFKLIDKPNSGYGATVNMGFKAAKGEYIGIVESDDYIENEMYEELYGLAKKLNLDLIKSHFYRFTTNKDGSYNQTLIINAKNVDNVFYPKECPEIIMNTTADWTGLYSKSFIENNNIKHNETPGASFQDIGFHCLTLSLAKRAYFVNKAYYHYRFDNPNSSINNKNKIYCANDEYSYVLKYYQENPKIGDIFEGFLWARFYNTCMITLEKIVPELENEYLNRFCTTFKEAQLQGKLRQECFDSNKWDEMNKLLNNTKEFIKKRRKSKKRKVISEKYNGKAPIYYRFKWSTEDIGLKQTILIGVEKTKRKMGVKHWDRADDISMHSAIAIRQLLKRIHLKMFIHDYSKILSLKNTHCGERCFIVCTGPSLRMEDLDKISNEYTFGMNTIFLAYDKTDWRPSCYVCVDAYAQGRLANAYDIDYSSISKGPVVINKRIRTNTEQNVYRIPIGFDNHTEKRLKKNDLRVESDLAVCAYDCFSVTNFAITTAIYMGFSEIYIIGCDCNYDGKIHFVQSKLDPENEEKNRWGNAVELSIRGYKTMKKYAEKNKVKIFNATRGGHLEVFDRIDFDSIVFK